jgi:hypothetical protein
MARTPYGHRHRQLCASIQTQISNGEVVSCARCRRPIIQGQAWDLDHSDVNPGTYNGPTHQRCNRRAGGQKRAVIARTKKRTKARTPTYTHTPAEPVNLDDFKDDPERGIYYGPPQTEGGTPMRWSRHWYDWRADTPANRHPGW